MNETYEEYMNRKLSESVQYKPKEEPTKITLYADDTPYQVIDLKDIDNMSEEEYNDKLKDAWLKKTYYETVEELTMSKYYNYTIEEVEEEKPKKKIDWSEVILVSLTYAIFIGVGIFLVWLILRGG